MAQQTLTQALAPIAAAMAERDATPIAPPGYDLEKKKRFLSETVSEPLSRLPGVMFPDTVPEEYRDLPTSLPPHENIYADIPRRVLQQSQDLGKRLSGRADVDIHAVPPEQGYASNQYGVRNSFGTPGFAPLTDAQARQRLVKNLGLKDESQLTYDAYGNISNVAEGYKRQLAEMRAEKDAQVARRRQARLDEKLAAAAEKDPRLALSLMLQQGQQAQAGSQAQAAAAQKAFENAIAQQELGLSQRAENRLGKKAELDEAKAVEESNPLSQKNISNALMSILGQVDWGQVPLQGEEGVKAVANIAMQLYAQANNGLYDPVENKVLTPDDIKAFAKKKTGGNYQEAYELLRSKVMAAPEEKKG